MIGEDEKDPNPYRYKKPPPGSSRKRPTSWELGKARRQAKARKRSKAARRRRKK